jgi:hypothetical protein
MEALFFVICSGFFGYIYQKLEKLEQQIDRIEIDLVKLEARVASRRADDWTIDQS